MRRFWLIFLLVFAIPFYADAATISSGGGHQIQTNEGTPATQRPKLNFLGTASCVDNAGNNSTDCDIIGAVPPVDLYIKGHTYPAELKNMSWDAVGPVVGSGWGAQATAHGYLTFAKASTEYIDVANESNFDFEYDSAFSISAWVKTTDATVNKDIVGKYAASGYIFRIMASGKLNVYILGASGGNINKTTDTVTVHDDLWHHVAMTKAATSAASGVNIYVDGVLVASTATADTLGTESILNNTSLQIGARNSGTSPFEGSMDNVAIFNTELALTNSSVITTDSIGTIKSLCGWNGTNCVKPVSGDYKNITGDESGLVSGFNLNEGTGSTATDIMGANNGTLVNTPTWVGGTTPTACKLGSKCVVFDSVDDYVKVFGADILPSGSGARTIEAWVYPTSSTKRSVIFSYGADTDNNLISLEVNGWQTADNGKLVFRTRNNAVKSTTSLTLNAWNWVAVTLSGTATTISGTDATLNTSDDAVELYVNSSTPETLVAVTGMGNTGTINTTAKQAYIGKDGERCKHNFGSCIKFDGTDDYVTVSDNVLFRPASNNLSLSAWIYRSVNTYGSIINYGTNANYRLHIQATGKAQFIMNGASVIFASTQEIPINKWTLVTVTAKSGDYRIYINANLAGQTATGTYGYGGSYAFNIGGGSASTYFNGQIDDVRIYDKILTHDEIFELYFMSYGNPCRGNGSGLVSCWAFNENTGATTASIPSGYTGTLTNFTSTTQDFDTDGWQSNGEFAGAIDEVALWNVALTGATTPTIAQRYNTGTGAELAGTESGLKLNYHFNYADTDTTLATQSATVSGIGSDSNECITTGSPCLTLNGALSKITSKFFAGSSTIHIASGVYSEEVIMEGYHSSGDYSLIMEGYLNPTPNQFSDAASISETSNGGTNTGNFPFDERSLFYGTAFNKDNELGWLKITGGTGLCAGTGYDYKNWHGIEQFWTNTSLSIVTRWDCGLPDNTTTYEIYNKDDMTSIHGGSRPLAQNPQGATAVRHSELGRDNGLTISDSSGISIRKLKMQNYDLYGMLARQSILEQVSGVMVEDINHRGLSIEQNTSIGSAFTGSAFTGGFHRNIANRTYAAIRAEKQSTYASVGGNIVFNASNCGFCNFFFSNNEAVYQNLWKNVSYSCYDGEHGFGLFTYGYNRSDTCGQGGGIEVAGNAIIRFHYPIVVTNSEIGVLLAHNGMLHIPDTGVGTILSYNDVGMVSYNDSFTIGGSYDRITFTNNTINTSFSGKIYDVSPSPVTGSVGGQQIILYVDESTNVAGTATADCVLVAQMSDGEEATIGIVKLDGGCP